MGKEWYNSAWENYWAEQGLDFEFTTPYAHQQNGIVERLMRTILDSTRTALAESGLCHDLAKQLSHYLYFFSFLFLFFYLGLTT